MREFQRGGPWQNTLGMCLPDAQLGIIGLGRIGARQLRRMKPSALLINTARAPIIDEAALITALREHWIAGAGLDVFDEEPLPLRHAFRSLDNVVATPHVGFVIEGNYRQFFGMNVDDIAAWLQGAPVRLLGGRPAAPKA